MSVHGAIAGSPGPLQSPEQEMRVLTGLAPLWQWGQSNLQCHESGTLADPHLEEDPVIDSVQSHSQCPVPFHLKQEPFPQLLLAFFSDGLDGFKALPIATVIILAFLFCICCGSWLLNIEKIMSSNSGIGVCGPFWSFCSLCQISEADWQMKGCSISASPSLKDASMLVYLQKASASWLWNKDGSSVHYETPLTLPYLTYLLTYLFTPMIRAASVLASFLVHDEDYNPSLTLLRGE